MTHMGAPRLEPASDEDRARIGATLREHRSRQGMTLREVAAAVGKTDGFLQNLEAGRRRPTPHMLAALAAVYRVDVAELTEVAA